MQFERNEYLNQIKSKMWDGAVKVVTGIRRCGKSVLLTKLFPQYLHSIGVKDSCISILSLEEYSAEEYRNPDRLYEWIENETSGDGKHYVIIDEIQYADRFVEILNEFMKKDNVDIYVSGSNSRFLSSDILTEFRGRGEEIRVRPLSFAEYCTVTGKDRHLAFREYSVYGGMPRLIEMKTDSEKTKYLSDLFKEVYLKDIIDRNGVRNDSDLEKVTDVLCSSIGSMINPKKIADTLRTVESSRITRPTVVQFIEMLADSFLFEESKRYDVAGRKYIGALSKYYAEDIGLRNARLNFRQCEMTHAMENIIYNELRRRGFSVDVGIARCRSMIDRVSETKEFEIDFVANKGNERYYIQSVFSIPDGEKREQETTPFSMTHDYFRKIIVTGDNVPVTVDEKGIVTMNIIDFLIDEYSLK